MNKTPHTLERDIIHVLNTGEGWTSEISEWVADDISKSLNRQFGGRGETGRGLRLSSLGTKCERKLWFSVNWRVEPEPIPPFTYSKFIFGDITESYVLGLCKAAGHRVEGLQDAVDVCGIRGHRDCIIDGMLFDVKSAATFSFQNFTKKGVRNSDSYGYVSQLSSYLYASRNDPLLEHKEHAGFLFFDKQFGDISVRILDLSSELSNKEEEVERKKKLVEHPEPPEREYEPVYLATGSKQNPQLPTNPCGYCQHKMECWGDLHVYEHREKGNRLYFTEVNKELREETWQKLT